MNLRPFLNRDVFVQFRGPWFVVAVNKNGQPEMAFVQNPVAPRAPSPIVSPGGEPPQRVETAPLQVPFAQGRFVERPDPHPMVPGNTLDNSIYFEYRDSVSGRKMEVLFHEDAFFSITAVGPDPNKEI